MKKLSLLIAPMMLVSVLAGCNKNVDDGKIHIKFIHNIDKTVAESIVHWADEFNTDETVNPDLKYFIEAGQTSGSYDDLVNKTVDQLSTDSYGDILYAYPDSIQKLIKRSVVVDLDDYINSDDPDLKLSQDIVSDIMPGYWQEGKEYIETGTYSMPFSKSSEVMFVNKRLIGFNLNTLKTKGIYDKDFSDVGTGGILSKDYLNSLTWEELFGKLAPALKDYNDHAPAKYTEGGTEVNMKLYEPDASGKSAVVGVDSDDNFFITLAKQYNIPYTARSGKEGQVLFDNDQMATLLVNYAQYYRDGLVTTGKIYGGEKKAYTSDLFLSNSCLFTISSTAGAKNIKSKSIIADALNVPHAADTTLPDYNKVISQGPSVCILDHGDDERIEGAWRFYKFFLEKKSALWAVGTTSGYLPILKSTYETEDYDEISSTTGKTEGSVDYCLAITYKYSQTIQNRLFSSPVFNQSAGARTQAGSAMAQALLSTGTKDAIRTILNTCAGIARAS